MILASAIVLIVLLSDQAALQVSHSTSTWALSLFTRRLNIFVDGNADPRPSAFQSSVDAIETVNDQHNTLTALTESSTIAPVISNLSPANMPLNPPDDLTTPIIRSLPSTHYDSLNDSYQFFSALPAHAIRKPSACARGFPLYFVVLTTCIALLLLLKVRSDFGT